MSDLPKIGTKEAQALPFYIGPSGLRKEVMVENPSTDFRSPLGVYKRLPSVKDPKKLMYRVVSDDPLDTAGREMTILDCAVEDAEALQAQADAEALRSFRSGSRNDPEKGEFGGVERGAPILL